MRRGCGYHTQRQNPPGKSAVESPRPGFCSKRQKTSKPATKPNKTPQTRTAAGKITKLVATITSAPALRVLSLPQHQHQHQHPHLYFPSNCVPSSSRLGSPRPADTSITFQRPPRSCHSSGITPENGRIQRAGQVLSLCCFLRLLLKCRHREQTRNWTPLTERAAGAATGGAPQQCSL